MALLPTDALFIVFQPTVDSTVDDCIEVEIIEDIDMDSLRSRRSNDGYDNLHSICTTMEEARTCVSSLLFELGNRILTEAKRYGRANVVND